MFFSIFKFLAIHLVAFAKHVLFLFVPFPFTISYSHYSQSKSEATLNINLIDYVLFIKIVSIEATSNFYLVLIM